MQAECTALIVNQTMCMCLHSAQKNECMAPYHYNTYAPGLSNQASVAGLVVRIDEVLGDLTSIRTLIQH